MQKIPAVSLNAAKEMAKNYSIADYGYYYDGKAVRYFVYIYAWQFN